jgi:anti-sigma-K factor RskA
MATNNDMKNSNEYDVLGDFFRQKLEGHRLPVDANDWDEIERRLNNQNRNKSAWWHVGAALAAAACFAGVMVLYMPTRSTMDQPNVVETHNYASLQTHNFNPDYTQIHDLSDSVETQCIASLQ